MGIGSSGAYVVVRSDAVLAAGRRLHLTAADEQRRRQLVRRQDRDDFVAARLAAILLMSHAAGVPVEGLRIEQSCDVCGGRHGRPSIANPARHAVSWSHHHGIVGVAVGAQPVGIDVVDLTGRSSDDAGDGPRGAPAWLEGIARAEALVKAGAGSLGRLLDEESRTPAAHRRPHVGHGGRRVGVWTSLVGEALVAVAGRHELRRVSWAHLLGDGPTT